LAESYVEALNKGGIPVIETAWQYMQSGELENAYRETLKFIEKEISSIKLPITDENLKKTLSSLKQRSYENFKSLTLGDITNKKNQ
jgi:hypothetical protein